MVKIYTKTGDKGKTSLYGGKRISKSDLRIEACGEVDELNSLIGVILAQNSKLSGKAGQSYPLRPHRRALRRRWREACSEASSSKLKTELIRIQNDLLEIGSILANSLSRHPELVSGSKNSNKKMLKQVQHDNYLRDRIEEIEKLIDDLSEGLPELKNFILPGGGELGSILHLARSVCRRVERKVVALSRKENISPEILIYFNRLSDLFFVMARFVNYKEKKKEIIWTNKK